MIVCDKCKVAIDPDIVQVVKNHFCSPGYGSTHDMMSGDHIHVNLDDGDYCCGCLDAAIEATPITHMEPYLKWEWLDNLMRCHCPEHQKLRLEGSGDFIQPPQTLERRHNLILLRV